MRFSILHTSARPDQWQKIYDAWMSAADNPGLVEYILVCDKRWGFNVLPHGIHLKAVWNSGRKCYVDGVNIAAAYATGDVLIVNADDQFPCEHWDSELMRRIPAESSGRGFVIEVSTNTPAEHDRKIMVMPILSRERYEKYGHVFYPAYESMYADNDFCELARRDGAVINARDLTFPHKHPIFDKTQTWDSVYEAQNRREAYDVGALILAKRRESNFGDVRVEYREQGEKPTVLLMLPGETFNQAYLKSLIEITANLAPQCHLDAQFSFSSNIYITRKYLLDTAKACPKRPTYILWIDDDQVLTLEGLSHLFKDLEQNPDLAGVAGWAWCEASIYGHEPMLSFGVFENGKSYRAEYERMQNYETDLIPIAYSGFPAILMRGSVLDTMSGDDFLPIFDRELFKPWGMSGEDAAFFLRANERGLKFAVDRRVKVPHLKLRCAEPVVGSSLEAAAIERTT